MADRYWVNDDADGDWNVANNWASSSGGAGGAGVPTGSDDVYFNAASSNDNCTLSAAGACLSLNIGTSGSLYTGTLDAATYNMTIGTGGLDCTYGGSATLDLGSGTWSCSGDFKHSAIGTLTKGTATVKMTGTANIQTEATKDIYKLRIESGATTTQIAGTLRQEFDYLEVAGTYTINDTVQISTDVKIETGGVINGSDILRVDTATISEHNGTWSVDTHIWADFSSMPAGKTWGGDWSFRRVVGTGDVTFPAGTHTWTGAVEFTDTGGTLNIHNDTNSPNLVFQGDLTLTETGTLVWTKGTQSITLSGTANQTITTPAGWTDRLEDITINKSAGNVVLAGDLYTDSFTGTDTGTGTFDPGGNEIDSAGACDWGVNFDFLSDADAMNGCRWDIGGNFTANAQTLNATAAWYLEVSGTAVASGVGAVAYSDASGFTQIDASSGPWTDNGNNSNWNFGVAVDTARNLLLLGVG